MPLPALGDHLCAAKLDHSNFGLFGLRPASAAMDLTTAYRYNQNMMEYYTCKSKSCYWAGGRVGGRQEHWASPGSASVWAAAVKTSGLTLDKHLALQ